MPIRINWLSQSRSGLGIMDPAYKEMLENFPNGISIACAYGSGVFKQTGHKSLKDNMIDFIFVLDDPLKWHKKNIERHPEHYSFLKHLGSGAVASLQEDFGAGVYFNSLIRVNNRLIKYGVVSQKCFQEDLIDWTSMYIAGRLHKPVLILKGENDKTFSELQGRNLYSAIRCALLCLPEKFEDKVLFLEIAGLSYGGDFRMIIGEDKEKISNIVIPNISNFRNLYKRRLSLFDHVNIAGNSSLIEQDLSPTAQVNHLVNLPKAMKWKLLNILGYTTCTTEQELEVFAELGKNRQKSHDLIKKATHSIVRYSSVTQSLKGILTAGVGRSIIYGGQKLQKMVRSMIR